MEASQTIPVTLDELQTTLTDFLQGKPGGTYPQNCSIDDIWEERIPLLFPRLEEAQV